MFKIDWNDLFDNVYYMDLSGFTYDDISEFIKNKYFITLSNNDIKTIISLIDKLVEED